MAGNVYNYWYYYFFVIWLVVAPSSLLSCTETEFWQAYFLEISCLEIMKKMQFTICSKMELTQGCRTWEDLGSTSRTLACLEVKREYYQNCSVLGCVTQCSQSAEHSWAVLTGPADWVCHIWVPYAMHRGGCLELYYCNMVEWSWWDSGFICKTN